MARLVCPSMLFDTAIGRKKIFFHQVHSFAHLQTPLHGHASVNIQFTWAAPLCINSHDKSSEERGVECLVGCLVHVVQPMSASCTLWSSISGLDSATVSQG